MRAIRCTVFVVSLGAIVFGCRCEEAPPATPPPVEESIAEPTGPAIAGWYCEGDGEAAPAPKDAFRIGPTWARRGPHWEDPPDDSARFLNVPGVRDLARRADDGAWLVRHQIPGGRYLVLTAKAHAFPPGAGFDAATAQKAFDEVAANPRTALIGARARAWGGRPAVEGVVSTPYPEGNVVIHHMIVQTDGQNGAVMTFIAPESQYHRYLSEACAALVVAK